jgi:threonine/homoserine/homoserine lactone efflux protein
VQIDWVRGALAVAGVGVLIALGGLGIRDALRPSRVQAADADPSQRGAFRSGLAISMANPMAVGYWLSMGGALVAAGLVGATTTQTLSFIAGYLAGTLGWSFIVAGAVRYGKRMMTPAVFRLVTLTCGAALVVFGVALAAQMLGVSA